MHGSSVCVAGRRRIGSAGPFSARNI